MRNGAGVAAALAVVAAAVALPASGNLGASSPTVACPLLIGTVDVEFGLWGGGDSHRPRERFALAGSYGAGNRTGGFMVYGSATPTRATTDRACRRTRARPNPTTRRLSKPHTYRTTSNGNPYFIAPDGAVLAGEFIYHHNFTPASGLALGLSFRCPVPSGVTVLIADSRDRSGRVVGSYFSARLGRELLATAVLRRHGASTFRISNRCERR